MENDVPEKLLWIDSQYVVSPSLCNCNLILSQKSHSVSSDNVVGDQEAECSCCKNGHDDQELIHLRLLDTNNLKFIDDYLEISN